MKVTAEDFRHQYADLSDEALLDIDRQELVDLARKCYDEELARRQLKTGATAPPARHAAWHAPAPAARDTPEPPASEPEPPAPEPPAPEQPDDDEDLVVAEAYDCPEAARLARELLRTNGIRARIGADALEVLVPVSTQEAAEAVLIAEISDESLAAASTRDSWVRPGFGKSRPYLYGSAGLLEFVRQVFGAVEWDRIDLGPGSVRVDAYISDSMLALEMTDSPPASAVPASVFVYVRDVDATYKRALNNGAEDIAPPEDKPYGERAAAVRDAFGNTWRIATYQA